MQLRGTAKNARTTNSLFALRIGLATKRPVSWISHFRLERESVMLTDFQVDFRRRFYVFVEILLYCASRTVGDRKSRRGGLSRAAARFRRRPRGSSTLCNRISTRDAFSAFFLHSFPKFLSSLKKEKAPFSKCHHLVLTEQAPRDSQQSVFRRVGM